MLVFGLLRRPGAGSTFAGRCRGFTRSVGLALESGRPVAPVARDIGLPVETLRKRVRQVQADEGLSPDLPTAQEREQIKQLRKETFELRRANEILKAASVFFATELDVDRPK